MPKHYTVHRAADAIDIDGSPNEASWQKATWSSFFIDIEGDNKTKPRFATRVKMLWDDEYFYFYTVMEEPHIWATLTERDAVVFQDNDFEIFIDPDGDTHNYVEFEVNALNTVWDLILTRPYRDGGRAINSWDIKGLKSAVAIDGTLNDPSDIDKGWSVEVAIPWQSLSEITRLPVPPKNGNQWRVNFSRVQWKTEALEGKYQKQKDTVSGKNLSEDNWVWSPQRAIAMHEPEYWGLVSFSDVIVGTQHVSIGINQGAEIIRDALYQIHRAQKSYKKRNGIYADNLSDLGLKAFTYGNEELMKPVIERFQNGLKYQITIDYSSSDKRSWGLDETGLLIKNKLR